MNPNPVYFGRIRRLRQQLIYPVEHTHAWTGLVENVPVTTSSEVHLARAQIYELLTGAGDVE